MTRIPLLALILLPLLLAAPPACGQPVIGYGKVWTVASRNVERRLGLVEELGGRAVFVATTDNGLTGGRGQMEAAAVFVDAARERGLRVVVGLVGRWNQVAELTPSELRAGGAAWGRWATSRLDVVMAFSVLNEVNLVGDRLRDQGEDAEAERAIAHEAALIVAFAEGVRSTCPRCTVLPGGLGGREVATGGRLAVRFMEELAPHARSGLLGGLDTHWYRTRNDFTFSRDSRGRLRATWNEDPSETLDGLLERAGWPRDTDLYVTEVNVRQTTFRSPEEAAAALSAMASALRADRRMRAIFLYSPFIANSDRALAQNYGISPGTPVGEAARAAARGAGGGPGGVTAPTPELPWYCRWFGIGCG
jgi:hypothetical protein